MAPAAEFCPLSLRAVALSYFSLAATITGTLSFHSRCPTVEPWLPEALQFYIQDLIVFNFLIQENEYMFNGFSATEGISIQTKFTLEFY